MIQTIVMSFALLLFLLVFNSVINYICGFSTSKEHGKVLEGTLTVGFLYLIIIAMLDSSMLPLGIPFVDKLQNYTSVSDMFHNDLGVFAIECAELISLTFLISLISSLIPSAFGGEGFTGTVIRSIVLVLVGVFANNYFLQLMQQTVFFSWATTALQCFLSGTAMLATPAMILGKILSLDPNSGFIAFMLQKLPETKIGKALSTAASNSLVWISVILIFESQFGSMTSLVSQAPAIISLFMPIVLMFIGIKLLFKSII